MQLKNRLKMAFLGWVSQFESIPQYQPKITEEHGFLYLDDLLSLPDDYHVVCLQIAEEHIFIYGHEDEYIISIHWPYDGSPRIKQIIHII